MAEKFFEQNTEEQQICPSCGKSFSGENICPDCGEILVSASESSFKKEPGGEFDINEEID